MSIELPAIPPQPSTTPPSTTALVALWQFQWDVYLRILAMHVQVETSSAATANSVAAVAAINAQTAQMKTMADVGVRGAGLMQQMIDQPPAASPPPPPADGAHRVVVAALMAEGGADRPPGDVATAVLARVAAVDSMLRVPDAGPASPAP